MVTRITAIEFQRAVGSGKSKPLLVVGETVDQVEYEVVAKFSACCERKVTSLAVELLAACLAAEVGLPVPEPTLLNVPREWSDLIPEASYRDAVQRSSSLAFGSRVITGQWGIWNSGSQLNAAMIPTAASILFFDGIIQNPDRRSENPNCFVRGNELRIFDHELAFPPGPILGWRPPWEEGGLKPFETPGFHIFAAGLKGRGFDFGEMHDSWAALTDARLDEFGSWVPEEWTVAKDDIQKAISFVKEARDNIDGCIAEAERVLS